LIKTPANASVKSGEDYNMRFLVAPDSFKESLSAAEAAQAIKNGIAAVLPNVEFDLAPLADGGEGTAECLLPVWGGHYVSCHITGPLGDRLQASYMVKGQRAVIEIASCCGIMLAPAAHRDPMTATSQGVGEMMLAAIADGCRELVIALGGSMTNDGGIGMLQALGAKILDENGLPVPPGGEALTLVASVDLSGCKSVMHGIRLTILHDVNSQLLGPHGATRMFGKQKGATPAQLDELEAGMEKYAALLERAAGIKLAGRVGSGAAGGLGAALMALSQCTSVMQFAGADYIMQAVNLPERIRACDLVIVGEGAIDDQSLEGKLPIKVAEQAHTFGRPVVAFVGLESVEAEAFHRHGIDTVYCILHKLTPIEIALRDATENLTRTAQTFAQTLLLAERIGVPNE
jgi:glycerate kinase